MFMTVCSKTGTIVAFSQYSPAPILLGCLSQAWYWISWTGGAVTLGAGNQTGLSPLLVFHDNAMLPINYMSVSSFKGTQQSIWIIPAQFYTTRKQKQL